MSFIEMKKDRLLLHSILAVAILAACHWIQYVKSGQMLQPLVRAVFATVYVAVAIFTGRRFWSMILFSWAMALLYFNRFYNYTSFVMILIAAGFRPKYEKPYLMLYSMGVIACLWAYHDSWTHLAIHCGGCYFFYMVYRSAMDRLKNSRKILELEPAERQILQALANGKQQKEIDFYSKNTVTKKLNNARIRNGCTTTGELLARFREQSHA